MQIKIDKLIRSNRRSIGLEINEEGLLIIRAPRSVSLQNIEKAIQSKKTWIERKQKTVNDKNFAYNPKSFIDGEEFLYLGTNYKLKINKDAESVFEFKNQFFLSKKRQVNAKAIFINWYKKQAANIITGRAEYYAKIYGFNYGSIKITGAKKRWGSCTGKNNLNFTWRLILAPIEIVDSVVLHELVHTVIKNHSKKFWAEVYDIMPDYPKYNQWLREKGYLLNLD